MEAGGHQAGNMRHIDHDHGADLVGDLAECGEIDDARIGAGADHDHLRPMLQRQALDLVIIDRSGLALDPVGDDIEQLAGKIDRGAVGQVTAMGQVHAEDGIARLQTEK